MARLLLVDDDLDLVDSLSLILSAHGHEVQTLDETTDLVEEVKRRSPDLVILDVIFPEDPQAGFVAARELAKDPIAGRVPVLILSAVNMRSGLAFGFSEADISDDFMPVQAFVEKPVSPEQLLGHIDKLLS